MLETLLFSNIIFIIDPIFANKTGKMCTALTAAILQQKIAASNFKNQVDMEI